MSETNIAEGWRSVKVTGGCLIEVASGETVVRGLTMPHSPRVAGGHLYVLNSGLGRLEGVDPSNGYRDIVCNLPGYARGLVICGSLAFVGLSKVRTSSAWDGVPIATHPENLKCGVWVVDLGKGTVIGHLEFVSGIDELFDVQLLPGVTCPFVSGPLAEHDSSHPLWTIMPSP